MSQQDTQRITMTVEECAKALGISRNSAYNLVAEGRLPHLRLGRRLVIPRVALDRLLKGVGSGVGETQEAATDSRL